MHEFEIDFDTYRLIRTGIVNSLVIDESKELLLNEPVILRLKDAPAVLHENGDLECSVNNIRTHKQEAGLKKDFSIISISVIRVIPNTEFLTMIK